MGESYPQTLYFHCHSLKKDFYTVDEHSPTKSMTRVAPQGIWTFAPKHLMMERIQSKFIQLVKYVWLQDGVKQVMILTTMTA